MLRRVVNAPYYFRICLNIKSFSLWITRKDCQLLLVLFRKLGHTIRQRPSKGHNRLLCALSSKVFEQIKAPISVEEVKMEVLMAGKLEILIEKCRIERNGVTWMPPTFPTNANGNDAAFSSFSFGLFFM